MLACAMALVEDAVIVAGGIGGRMLPASAYVCFSEG